MPDLSPMRIALKRAALAAALTAAGAVVLIDTSEGQPAGVAALAQPPVRETPTASAVTAPTESVERHSSAQQSLALPQRSGLSQPPAPLFSSRSWQAPPPEAVAHRSAPPSPTAPSVPFRFAGRMLQGDQVFVFLERGESIITARQGDTVDGAYRIDSVSETQVALTYVPLDQKQTIAVVSSLPKAVPSSVAAPSPWGPPAESNSAPAWAAPPGARTGGFPIPTANVIAPAAAGIIRARD